MKPASTALHALVEGLIDYAGLFPPAALAMGDAVAAYLGHLQGPDAALLGRFVVPVGRLDELAVAQRALLDGKAPAEPWRLSAIAGARDAATLRAFNEASAGWAVVDTVEARATSAAEVESVVNGLPADLVVFVELPIDADLEALLPVLQRLGARAKVRTGGLSPELFPTSHDLAAFVEACIRHGVPCKATAGLHHALRGSYPMDGTPAGARATMHGFVNLFAASAMLRDGASIDEAAALLDETTWGAFSFNSEAISWRGRRITVSRVLDARAHCLTSYGSCSFDDPIYELRELGLL